MVFPANETAAGAADEVGLGVGAWLVGGLAGVVTGEAGVAQATNIVKTRLIIAQSATGFLPFTLHLTCPVSDPPSFRRSVIHSDDHAK